MLNLRELIELRRAEMIQLADEFGFLDERVLAKSQELDLLINEFERNRVKIKIKNWAFQVG
ncbi:aspartyl-phosphate phosphatase Spo0E family protein [Paenibacillus turicensis]|uniref:Spo0E family sporulation regulatory protein-aspartic acid phosphatase n=1 Tax=Paenibacillus turicensis TaxID=160487 RepID=UPI003D2977D4